MTPADWNAALAPHVGWQAAYGTVENAVKLAFASPVLDGQTLSTSALVEALYPEQFARGEGITARKRIYKALAALATRGLAAYATRGPERLLKHTNKLVRPWLWHSAAPIEVAKCPHCGKEIAP